MLVAKNKTYRIKKGKSDYFKKKYGTDRPLIRIEDTTENVFNGDWMDQAGNPACMLAAFRMGMELMLPGKETCYYGKVGNHGEIVAESELEEVEN